MLRALRNLLPLRRGFAGRAGGRFRDPRFVSFLAASNRKTLNTDFQDAVLQGRRVFRKVVLLLMAAGGAWILVESAKALTLF